MNQTLEDRVSIIRESFQASSAELMEVSGSFRVNFESGQSVYIYVETYDNSITARFELKEADPAKRGHEIDTLRHRLTRELCFADISEFAEVQSKNDRFVYTADVRMDESVFFHETIVMGNDEPDVSDSGFIEGREDSLADTGGHEPEPGPAASQSLAEKAVSQLETIDAKMLRQSLDMMNLKRSSNVRIALNRIFRSAGDAEDLMQSIQNEAGKLTAQNDVEDLRIIKTINTDGFLEPVIVLLCDAVSGNDGST